jgi:Flp pilus assembly protein TadG
MFTLDTTIDAIQTGKKQFVNTVFANNKTIAEALNGFVDAQAAYTKQAVKAGTDVATKLSSEAVKVSQEMAKFDITKVFSSVADTFNTAKK